MLIAVIAVAMGIAIAKHPTRNPGGSGEPGTTFSTRPFEADLRVSGWLRRGRETDRWIPKTMMVATP